ncbi:MAG TPA: methylated-DNA--[protein]-cysteine S-methyltransferase [Actinomycetaceae bacterium]|nr:methylated-DNA--[protein]-cysteine S-methyltransferase [Actinomycetaceae bacterium]
MKYRLYDSPVGDYLLAVDGEGYLTGIYRADDENAPALGVRDDAVADEAANQLDEYFAGTRKEFDLALAPRGTEFQRAVWSAIARIPYGEARSYGAIAAEVGSSPRAVGGACGRNPHSIVVPCHRVLAANGMLNGYGGGLDTKRWLLRHEGVAFREAPGQ